MTVPRRQLCRALASTHNKSVYAQHASHTQAATGACCIRCSVMIAWLPCSQYAPKPASAQLPSSSAAHPPSLPGPWNPFRSCSSCFLPLLLVTRVKKSRMFVVRLAPAGTAMLAWWWPTTLPKVMALQAWHIRHGWQGVDELAAGMLLLVLANRRRPPARLSAPWCCCPCKHTWTHIA